MAVYYQINLCSYQSHRNINDNYSAHVKAIWWVKWIVVLSYRPIYNTDGEEEIELGRISAN